MSSAFKFPEGNVEDSTSPVLDPSTSIAEWLATINSAVTVYAQALADYGYDNVGMLVEAEQAELEEALDEVAVKKPHRKAILRGFAKLKLQEAIML